MEKTAEITGTIIAKAAIKPTATVRKSLVLNMMKKLLSLWPRMKKLN